MDIPTYRGILTDKKDADAALVDSKVKQAYAKANLAVAQVEEDLRTRELDLKRAYVASGLDFNHISGLLDGIASVQRKLTQFEELVESMFAGE
jgi:hypothetical protein